MGVKGIAYATIAAEFIATVYVFYRIKKMTEFFDNITVWDFFPKIQYQLDLLRQALPASLNMFCVSAGFFVITFFASFFPSPDTSNISIASYGIARSEEHTSELQSQAYLVCRSLLEKKKAQHYTICCSFDADM